jgi:4-hydroxythreonine-4-phosphate dehydrogenase
MSNPMPRIALTMGDPAGVGPELCLQALASAELTGTCVPLVFGDAEVLNAAARKTRQTAPQCVLSLSDWKFRKASIDRPSVIDVGAIRADEFKPGTIDAVTGAASFAYINAAIDAALAGMVAAVTTAPINKEALAMAGIKYPGHTEIFAERAGSKRWCMMQYSEEITCTFVTVHVGYSQVPGLLNKSRILEVIELSAGALERIRGHKPRIVVCGLNPHAGEHGLFGDREEERLVIPAIDAARAEGFDVEGPVPPDTAFLPWKRKTTDVYVCLYHDQGHIPVKALAFDSAVNTTLGLPIVRTSVDHGTALDIAWQGKANPGSLFSALHLAAKLAD